MVGWIPAASEERKKEMKKSCTTLTIVLLLVSNGNAKTRAEKRAEKQQRMKAEAEASLPVSERVNAAPSDVKNSLVLALATQGWSVVGDSAFQIAFSKDVPVTPDILSYLLIGNNVITAQRWVVQFMLSSDGQSTVVSTSVDSYLQDGWGRSNRYNVSGAAGVKAAVSSFLSGVKEQFRSSVAKTADGEQISSRETGDLALYAWVPESGEEISIEVMYSEPGMRAKRTVTTRLELLTLLRAALGLTQAEAESQADYLIKNHRSTFTSLRFDDEKLKLLRLIPVAAEAPAAPPR
jgi:hypothetical protein